MVRADSRTVKLQLEGPGKKILTINYWRELQQILFATSLKRADWNRWRHRHILERSTVDVHYYHLVENSPDMACY